MKMFVFFFLNLFALGFPSITVLVFPDFADAYSRTTASYRLTQLSGQIPESSQFLGASKLPLLEWPCLKCRNWNAYLLSFAYPPTQACVSYLSAMILLFLDFQGALFHSPLELKITVNSIYCQKHLGICLPTVGSQTWVCSGWEFFPHKWGIEPTPMAMNQIH